MFISWIKFPARQDAGGLVPNKVADAASFTATAGSMDFNWGDNTGTACVVCEQAGGVHAMHLLVLIVLG